MFTGIIEETGTIQEFSLDTLKIGAHKVLQDLQIGDSICVNGVCQTVIEFNSNSFTTRLSQTTRNITSFNFLKKGDIVNLERALTLSSRLGGHIVSGHVEAVAQVSKIDKISGIFLLFFVLFIYYLVKFFFN